MPTATIRGVGLDHERRGSGPTLIWGHGLTSSRTDELVDPAMVDWDRATERLDVVRYDALGHGRSGFTTDLDRYRWDQLAFDQLALLDHLGIGRCAVGGASMGAATALHLAVGSPERVSALVLAIPPTAWDTRAAQAGNYQRMADLIDGGRLEAILAAGRELPPPDPFVGHDRWPDRSAARLRGFEPAQLATLFRGAAGADLPPPDQIATLDLPTLILAWTGDPGHPASTARDLADLMPQATLHLASTRAEFDTWTDRIVDFLTEVSAPS